MGLLLLCALVFLVYFLGEQAGRESPTRTKQVQEIVSKETELKNLKTHFYATTTPHWLYFVIVVLVIFLILKMFGGWHDVDSHYHRHRH